MTRVDALATLVLAASLAGCGAPATTGPVTFGEALGAADAAQAAMVARGADAKGTVKVLGADGYVLQALTAWNKADVTKVTLRLYKKSGASWTSTGVATDVANAALANAVTLSNLKLATEYKVVAEAYDATSARVDNQAQVGSDADCSVTFTTPSLVAAAAGDHVDDATITFTAPVKLMNKTFAGQARSGSGVAVTNGTITSTTATETF